MPRVVGAPYPRKAFSLTRRHRVAFRGALAPLLCPDTVTLQASSSRPRVRCGSYYRRSSRLGGARLAERFMPRDATLGADSWSPTALSPPEEIDTRSRGTSGQIRHRQRRQLQPCNTMTQVAKTNREHHNDDAESPSPDAPAVFHVRGGSIDMI